MVFVGPSGCGKSTLLRLIAGLEDVTSGQIRIDGEDATRLPPAKRGLAMVFQSYALYPHMSVRKNIAFPLRMAGLDEAEQKRRVEGAAKVLNLTNYIDRRPGQLSGGQRQRVAIGRAIVREPKALVTFSRVMRPIGRVPYLTAPKVRPRTSCFWLNQPMMRIGAIAIVLAAESLA